MFVILIAQFLIWSDYFSNQGIEIIEMSPDKHDRLAARVKE